MDVSGTLIGPNVSEQEHVSITYEMLEVGVWYRQNLTRIFGGFFYKIHKVASQNRTLLYSA